MLGAIAAPDGTTFAVFATTAKSVSVRIFDATGARALRTLPLSARGDGLYEATFGDVHAGAHYKFVLDDDEVPDPYARFLPFGVHGPARVVAPAREPALASPPPPSRWILYELHVGAFTEEGTYRAAIERLDDLVALGVTAIELLPVHAFPGARGWGYDGVALYAPYAPYGEPDDLRAFVRAAHERGLAVVLDVVFNHFGPSGNYLARYAPSYFTKERDTPWGQGPAFADPRMRALVLDNVAYWLDEFGFDGLRLDATHEIHDASSRHVLREIADLAHSREPRRRVFFEDERNDPAVVKELGADGVWADDLHHQIHVLLTGERDGYYAAYDPTVAALARCIREGWTYTGQPYASWKGRPRGRPAGDLGYEQLVTCLQNHDQVGNRALGTRLSAHVDPGAFCAAVVLLLFLPTTPLLFMGQEWGASTPFLFFSDHEGEIGANVSKGRREEFKSFAAFADPAVRSTIPDPQAASTFASSKLRWAERAIEPHASVLAVHRAMLDLRRNDPVLSQPCARGELSVEAYGDVVEVVRSKGASARRLVVSFGTAASAIAVPPGWRTLYATPAWNGSVLGAKSAVVLGRD